MQATRKVTYDELRQAGLPKSRAQMLDEMFQNAFQIFKKDMPRNLIVLLIIIGGVFFLNFLIVVCSRMIWCHDGDSFLSNVTNYLFASSLGMDGFKGFYSAHKNTTRAVVNLDLVAILGVTSFLKRFKQVKGKSFSDIFTAFSVQKAAAKFSDHTDISYVFRGFLIAFLMAYVLKNPFAIVLATVFLLAETGRAKEGLLFQTIFQWRLLSPKKKVVTDADVVLDIFWVAVGLLLYLPVILITWVFLRYGVLARFILTLLFSGLFLLIALTAKKKVNQSIATMLFFICTAAAIFYFMKINAAAVGFDISDNMMPPRRRASGTVLRQFGEEAKDNAGSSFFRSAWAVISLAASQVWSQVAGFFSHGTYNAVSAAANMSNSSNSFDMGLQAYQSAMSNIPGLGESVSNAASAIDAGMNGK